MAKTNTNINVLWHKPQNSDNVRLPVPSVVPGSADPRCCSISNFNTIGHGWVVNDSTNFPRPF